MSADTARMRALANALASGTLEDHITEKAAERGREMVIDSWSGVVPPRSSPGSQPAIETGALSRSIGVVELPTGGHAVVANTAYARALEYGFPARNLQARPFMLPMALALWGEINRRHIAETEIKRFIAQNVSVF